jgi:hypothetical protein
MSLPCASSSINPQNSIEGAEKPVSGADLACEWIIPYPSSSVKHFVYTTGVLCYTVWAAVSCGLAGASLRKTR